jgi:hypothetical protein
LWTKDEDERMLSFVAAYRNGLSIPWDQIAYYMDGRTVMQCKMRYNRSICDQLRHGHWSEDEDLVSYNVVCLMKLVLISSYSRYLSRYTALKIGQKYHPY